MEQVMVAHPVVGFKLWHYWFAIVSALMHSLALEARSTSVNAQSIFDDVWVDGWILLPLPLPIRLNQGEQEQPTTEFAPLHGAQVSNLGC